MHVNPHVAVMLAQPMEVSANRLVERWGSDPNQFAKQRYDEWTANTTMLEESFASSLLLMNSERPIDQVFYDIAKAAEVAMGIQRD